MHMKLIPSALAPALMFLILTPSAEAVSVGAGTTVCKGFFGTVGNLRPACGNGNAGGGGAVLIPGNGSVSLVGSGINFPFATDSSNSEFSASAAALQDYGVFKGYAHLHVTEQFPDLFGGAYSANADGEYRDTWTIGGGTGQGLLGLSFTVSGNASAKALAPNGNGSEVVDARLLITTSLNGVFGGGINTATGGIFTLAAPNAMVFTFGVPFELSVSHSVGIGGTFDRDHPPSFYQLDADASFENTATLTGITATDLFGNPIEGITLTAASGTHYPLTVSAVPIMAPLWLLASGVAALRLRRKHRVA